MTANSLRHLVVLGHPRRGSFNHQVAEAYCAEVRAHGHHAVFRDLYASRFDPVLELIPEAPELSVLYDLTEARRCDVLAFVYPLWFGMPPAIIKGYIDRVLGAGFAPDRDHLRADARFLKGCRMISFSTSASTEPWLSERGQLAALREGVDRYLGTVFEMASTTHVHIDGIVEGLDPGYATAQLDRVRDTVRTLCVET